MYRIITIIYIYSYYIFIIIILELLTFFPNSLELDYLIGSIYIVKGASDLTYISTIIVRGYIEYNIEEV